MATKSTWLLITALYSGIAVVPGVASAAVEKIIVTASVPVTPEAMAFYKKIEVRLTPVGNRFVADQSEKLRAGTLQPSVTLLNAKQACASSFHRCGNKDDVALASYTFAEAAYGIGGMLWVAKIVSNQAFETAYQKTAGTSDFDPVRAQSPEFRAALLANMTPKDRAAMVAFAARRDKLRDAMLQTLKVLGFSDNDINTDNRARKN